VTFRNKLTFYSQEFLAPRPTPMLEDNPLLAYSVYSQLSSNQADQVQDDEMARSCSTNGVEEECI
jgi:hypothetical protein